MIKLFKKNKLLFILISSTVLCFIFGILFNSFIDNDSKTIINNNIINIVDSIKKDNITNFSNFISLFFSNSLIILIIWIFGISIIGILLVYFLYLFKVFIFSFEFISLLVNLKLNNILFILIYIVPSIINILFLFITTYYSISFSFMLFRILFKGESINIRRFINTYLKVLLLVILGCFINGILEIVIIPKLLIFLF